MPRWVGILAFAAATALAAFAIYNLVEFVTGDHDFPYGIVGAAFLSGFLLQAGIRIEREHRGR